MHFIGSAPLESLSLWERWHCEAMTERASPARKSRCAAMGRLFVRAMLSLCLCFTCSGLALSGASRQLSQRESPWHFAKLYLFARGSPTRGNNDDRRQRPCPLRRFAPALPKGEPLAGRSSFLWTRKAYLFRGL